MLLDILDRIDGDPDLEDNGDLEPSLAGSSSFEIDAEGDTADDEPDLGWSNPLGVRFDARGRLIIERAPDRQVRP